MCEPSGYAAVLSGVGLKRGILSLQLGIEYLFTRNYFFRTKKTAGQYSPVLFEQVRFIR